MIERNIDDIFRGFPPDSYWKLFVDGMYWDKGESFFDNDESPGYLRNMSRAFCNMLLTASAPLTVDTIFGLHKVALPRKSQGICFEITSILNAQSITLDGLEELIANIREKNLKLEIMANSETEECFILDPALSNRQLAEKLYHNVLTNPEWSSFKLSRKTTSEEDDCAVIEQYLRRYYAEINKAGTVEDKLTAIARFIRDIHQYHVFLDGNGRTFIFLILNKLLIQNNLLPTIFEIPGIFSGWSVKELAKKIHEGQERFRSLFPKNPDMNKPSFMKVLLEKAEYADDNEKWLTLANVDLQMLLEQYKKNDQIKEFFHSYKEQLIPIIVSKRDPVTIERFLNTIKLSNSEFLSLYEAALKRQSLNFIRMLYKADKLKFSEIAREIKKKHILFTNIVNLPVVQGMELFLQLEMTSADYYDYLMRTIGNIANNYRYIAWLKDGIFKKYAMEFLKYLTATDLEKLMAHSFQKGNGLQLLALYGDKNIFRLIYSTLDEGLVKQLIAQPIRDPKIREKIDQIIEELKLLNNLRENSLFMPEDRLSALDPERKKAAPIIARNTPEGRT